MYVFLRKTYAMIHSNFLKKESKMAIPFVLGLVIGGGAVYAYNNREELSKQVKAKSKELKAGLKKGQETLDKVSTSIKNGAKSLTKSIKSGVNSLQQSSTQKSTPTSASKATHAKTTKSTKPKSAKTATKPTKKVAQTTAQPTLITNSSTL